jgi:hypothetical protein
MIAWLRGVAILPSVTLPQLCHEVAIEHRLPHLLLLLSLRQLVARASLIKSDTGLIEHLLLIQLIYIWQHFMDARIVGGLQHDARLSCIHLINAQRTATHIVGATLLPHSVGHKESLIWFLSSKPTKI